MFNLEQSIAEWRRQMLAAGIKTPAPLDELEIHLREEIEQQMKSGLNEQDVFNSAVQKIGQAGLLKREFKKAGGFAGWLGENKTTRTNRVLGLLWLVYCVGSFYKLTKGLSSAIWLPDFKLTPFFLFALLMDFIYLRGLIASILLFGGVMRERRFLRLLACLDAIGGITILIEKPFQPLVCGFTILGLVSIWLLRPPQKPKLATT